MTKLKVCHHCGILYDESIRVMEDDAYEYNGYGRILCVICRHDHTINRLDNEELT